MEPAGLRQQRGGGAGGGGGLSPRPHEVIFWAPMIRALWLMAVVAWVQSGCTPFQGEGRLPTSRCLRSDSLERAHSLGVESKGKRGPPGKKEPRRRRPVNLSRCLDSAAAGGHVFNAFCSDIENSELRAACRSKILESEQNRRNFCANYFGT